MPDPAIRAEARETHRWEAATPGVFPVEADLVAALRQGDGAAYEELINRFERPVYSLIYRLLPHPDDARDVVQDVFLKVFRRIGSFRGESTLKTWIYRIAVNEAHNHRRWFGRKRGHEVGLEDDTASGLSLDQVLEDAGRSPIQSAMDAETRALIEEALRSMKPAFREAVVLRDVEELPYEEIAEVLGLNLGTVKSRILRGRDALRKALAARLRPSRPEWRMETAGEWTRS